MSKPLHHSTLVELVSSEHSVLVCFKLYLTIVFQAEDMSFAILTTNSRKGYPDMAGRINYMGGQGIYVIENCGEGCHVLIKLGKKLLDFSEPEVMPPAGARSLTEAEMDPVVNKFQILCKYHSLCCWSGHRARLIGQPQFLKFH
jgi:hypothetical protein